MFLYSFETCKSGAFLEFKVSRSLFSTISIVKSGIILEFILVGSENAAPGFGFNFSISLIAIFKSFSLILSFRIIF